MQLHSLKSKKKKTLPRFEKQDTVLVKKHWYILIVGFFILFAFILFANFYLFTQLANNRIFTGGERMGTSTPAFNKKALDAITTSLDERAELRMKIIEQEGL